jgi:membrane dipeptidase
MLELSKAPIILSHSGVRAVYNHPRNLDDVRLRALAAHGGVIQINAYAAYMGDVPEIAARTAALAELAKRLPARSRTEADAIALQAARAEIDRKWPLPRASIDDVVQHIQHAVQVAGIDHVGLSGDFDGGGGVSGLDDVTDYPRLTGKLLAAGFTAGDLAKFWGGNALRVLRKAQAMADR